MATTPDDSPQEGIECPRCGCRHFYTTHVYREPGRIKRRRECRNCGRPVKTYEYPAPPGDKPPPLPGNMLNL